MTKSENKKDTRQVLIESSEFISKIKLSKELKEAVEMSAGKAGTLIVKNIPCTILNRVNQNGRIYSTEVVQAAIDEATQLNAFESKQLLSQACEHPEGSFVSPTTASHVVIASYIKPNIEIVVEGKKGRFDVLFQDWEVLNTAEGKNLRALFEAECSIGTSIRGVGDMNGKYVENYSLLGCDCVGNPSSSTFTRMPVSESVKVEFRDSRNLNETFTVTTSSTNVVKDLEKAAVLQAQLDEIGYGTVKKTSTKLDSEVDPKTGAETTITTLEAETEDEVTDIDQALALAKNAMLNGTVNIDSITIEKNEEDEPKESVKDEDKSLNEDNTKASENEQILHIANNADKLSLDQLKKFNKLCSGFEKGTVTEEDMKAFARSCGISSLDDEERYGKCAWCGEEFPLSDLRYEKDLGYLCNHCAKGLESREGKLNWENDYIPESKLDEGLGGAILGGIAGGMVGHPILGAIGGSMVQNHFRNKKKANQDQGLAQQAAGAAGKTVGAVGNTVAGVGRLANGAGKVASGVGSAVKGVGSAVKGVGAVANGLGKVVGATGNLIGAGINKLANKVNNSNKQQLVPQESVMENSDFEELLLKHPANLTSEEKQRKLQYLYAVDTTGMTDDELEALQLAIQQLEEDLRYENLVNKESVMTEAKEDEKDPKVGKKFVLKCPAGFVSMDGNALVFKEDPTQAIHFIAGKEESGLVHLSGVEKILDTMGVYDVEKYYRKDKADTSNDQLQEVGDINVSTGDIASNNDIKIPLMDENSTNIIDACTGVEPETKLNEFLDTTNVSVDDDANVGDNSEITNEIEEAGTTKYTANVHEIENGSIIDTSKVPVSATEYEAIMNEISNLWKQKSENTNNEVQITVVDNTNSTSYWYNPEENKLEPLEDDQEVHMESADDDIEQKDNKLSMDIDKDIHIEKEFDSPAQASVIKAGLEKGKIDGGVMLDEENARYQDIKPGWYAVLTEKDGNNVVGPYTTQEMLLADLNKDNIAYSEIHYVDPNEVETIENFAGVTEGVGGAVLGGLAGTAVGQPLLGAAGGSLLQDKWSKDNKGWKAGAILGAAAGSLVGHPILGAIGGGMLQNYWASKRKKEACDKMDEVMYNQPSTASDPFVNKSLNEEDGNVQVKLGNIDWDVDDITNNFLANAQDDDVANEGDLESLFRDLPDTIDITINPAELEADEDSEKLKELLLKLASNNTGLKINNATILDIK